MHLYTDTNGPTARLTGGFEDHERDEIARMYWSAFGSKLGSMLNPSDKAIVVLREALDPRFALVARAGDGQVLGVAGYKTRQGSFVDITFSHLRRSFGIAGAIWRGLALSFLLRKSDAGTLLMDGIFVAERARGQGVGTLLLTGVKRKARELGCALVRLEVIDTNVRARQLYEREGFRAVSSHNLGPLRHLFGFRTATVMLAESGQT